MTSKQMLDLAARFSALRDLTGKHVLILGGLGFLGRWVAKVATANGASVTVLDRSQRKFDTANVSVIHDDLRSFENLDALIRASDVVVHLAGSLGTESTFLNLQETVANNIVVTAKVIELCLAHRRRAVYPMVGNDWANPYSITRRCAADLGLMANLECEGDFRILRVMNAYGPGQAYNRTLKIIPTFTRQCLLNQPIPIYGDGNQCIDLVHAQDVAVAFLLACVVDDLPRDEYIDVGNSIPYRVVEVALKVRAELKSSSDLEFTGKRRGEPLHSVTLARDDTLRAVSGFSPQISLDVGLENTIKWYVDHPEYLGL